MEMLKKIDSKSGEEGRLVRRRRDEDFIQSMDSMILAN